MCSFYPWVISQYIERQILSMIITNPQLPRGVMSSSCFYCHMKALFFCSKNWLHPLFDYLGLTNANLYFSVISLKKKKKRFSSFGVWVWFSAGSSCITACWKSSEPLNPVHDITTLTYCLFSSLFNAYIGQTHSLWNASRLPLNKAPNYITCIETVQLRYCFVPVLIKLLSSKTEPIHYVILQPKLSFNLLTVRRTFASLSSSSSCFNEICCLSTRLFSRTLSF